MHPSAAGLPPKLTTEKTLVVCNHMSFLDFLIVQGRNPTSMFCFVLFVLRGRGTRY